MITADVCANVPIKNRDQIFSYIVPDELNYVGVGWRVMVPFGRRSVDGFILRIYESDPDEFDFELKEIASAIDDEAWFTPADDRCGSMVGGFLFMPVVADDDIVYAGAGVEEKAGVEKKAVRLRVDDADGKNF